VGVDRHLPAVEVRAGRAIAVGGAQEVAGRDLIFGTWPVTSESGMGGAICRPLNCVKSVTPSWMKSCSSSRGSAVAFW
jgi:hypothetical protein